MKITKLSMATGKEHTLDLPITQAQIDLWNSGKLIQNVFPHLTADQREFMMTGITPEEWDKFLGVEDD